MLEQLLIDDGPDDVFIPIPAVVIDKKEIALLKNIDARTLLAAKQATAGVLDAVSAGQRNEIEDGMGVFAAGPLMAAPDSPLAASQSALMTTPESVNRAATMLSRYELDFVEHAKRIRSMLVEKLIDETEGSIGSNRLRAIELLGKVAEVGLFTDKQAHEKEILDEQELDKRIQARLNKRFGSVTEVPLDSATAIEVQAVPPIHK